MEVHAAATLLKIYANRNMYFLGIQNSLQTLKNESSSYLRDVEALFQDTINAS